MDRRSFFATIGTATVGAAAAAAPVVAQGRKPPPANPQIDYRGFQRLSLEVGELREKRLLPFAKFKQGAKSRSALLLDARSETAFREGHIRGAANLPLPDFDEASLADTIGRDRDRRILIYCNNNFSNSVRPVPMKSRQLALNIQTFINLVGYGYRNVWELADVIDFNDPKVDWVRA